MKRRSLVRRRRGLLAAAAALLAVSASARAQLVTDEVPRAATVPVREELQRDLDESRFRLGALRIAPRLMVDNFGYNDNVNGSTDNPVSDVTGTVSLGARLTLPLSPKLALRADLFPAYIWYAHEPERRAFGGQLSASLLALFNHLTFVATGWGSIADSVVSTEVLAIQREKVKGARGDLDVAILRRLSIVANGEVQDRRYSAGGATEPVSDYSVNDRTDVAARGGIRYRFTEAFDLSLGVEGTWTDFEKTGPTRDNESRAAVVGISYERPRIVVHLSGAYRKGEAKNGSTFPSYTEPTGSGYVSVTVVRPLDLEAIGRRRITYSVGSEPPYYLETRYGGGVKIRIGKLVTLHGTAEWGQNRYTVGDRPDPAGRVDDAREIGGTVDVALGKSVTLGASFTRARYDSNIEGLDRKYNQFGFGLRIGRDFL